MTDLRIGFAGLGLMGAPMARRVMGAGFPLTVWNRTAAKCATFEASGAAAAETPKALSDASDIVFLCLMDAASVEEVVFGSEGLSDGGAALVVDFTTGHPDAARRIADRLRAASGAGWIDAPVSGGVPGAETGTLAIMAGGEEEEIERARPAVMACAARFTRMGPVGAGQTTKLVNQIISGCTMSVVAEAVAFAERTGVDASRLTEALAGGFADSKPFQIFAPRMAARTFEPKLGATDTMIKDLDLVEELAETTGARIPLTRAALTLMRAARDAGESGEDISTLIRRFE